MTDVGQWLDSLDLGQYAAAFEENAIAWVTLPELRRMPLASAGKRSHSTRVNASSSAGACQLIPG